MQSLTSKLSFGVFTGFVCLFALKLAAATVGRPLPHAMGDELAVWQVVAEDITRENAANPYNLWYVVSDFTAASFIASAMGDPDRDQFCGLSGAQAQAMISELKMINAKPVALDASVAKEAGLKVAYAKNPRQRYFALSRVVFNPEGTSAWLSVELNGARGSIVRLDKIDSRWTKTSKCAGWFMSQ